MHENEIQNTLPKTWEQEETFHDVLYDWMDRAPWVAISLGLHFVAYFLLLASPWDMFKKSEEVIIHASPAPEIIKEEDPPEVPDEELVDIPTEDPQVVDLPDTDVVDIADDMDNEDPLGEPDQLAQSPFDNPDINGVIGVGGPPGGKFGNRGDGRKGTPGGSGGKISITIEAGLDWLAEHQHPDGYWDVDQYHAVNVADKHGAIDGEGIASQDVGITALALLAFLGDGHSTRSSESKYRDTVLRGFRWLCAQQDQDSGLIGEAVGHGYVYDHAIAALALAENCYLSKSPFHKQQAQKAMNFIARARAPYGGWRYDVPSDGDTDTSITGWMIFALKAGQEAGLKIDREGYAGALQWLDEVSDPNTGRAGYTDRGGRSSRTDYNADYAVEETEAMTGVALLTRIFLGQTPDETPIMERHADLMLRSLPEWDKKGHKVDMYYWYYATYAMYQMGGNHWRKWKAAMEPSVLANQRKDGDYLGSWDPVGPWGYQGGRVYSTATMVLTLEVYYRYAGLLGTR